MGLNFLIPISLQPDGVNLICFKRRYFYLTEFIEFEGLRYWVGLENLSLRIQFLTSNNTL